MVEKVRPKGKTGGGGGCQRTATFERDWSVSVAQSESGTFRIRILTRRTLRCSVACFSRSQNRNKLSIPVGFYSDFHVGDPG